MPHLLITFADAAQTEVPAIVCDDAGYTYDFADEREAGRKVRTGRYDLVLLVTAHPLPIARAVQAIDRAIPMIAIAAELSADVYANLRAEGVRQVLFRPYSIQALRRALADAVATRREEGREYA